jgi:ligand-binding sensor domain-containing protein/DNA-binding CsgD family transcriptional regulator
MKICKLGLLLGLVLTGAWHLGSQIDPLMTVEHITANATPLQMEIHAVLLGGRGFLWIGSQDGLARFDGYRVIPWRFDEAKERAGGDQAVRAISEDQNGRLWLATARGLVRYDPGSGEVARFRHEKDRPDTVSADDLTCLFISPKLPGRLWIASSGGDLDGLDLESGRVTRCSPAAAGASRPGTINVISSDAGGSLWIGAANGLYRFLPLEGRLQSCPPPGGGKNARNPFSVRSILNDKRFPDSLWIGSEGAGLFRYFPATGLWQPGRASVSAENPIVDARINALAPFPGQPQALIVATDDGLFSFDPGFGSVQRLGLVFNKTDVQTSQCTKIIYPDPFGNYWISTCRSGMDKWSPVKKDFARYRPYENVLPGALANWVTSVQELADGEIIVTTYGGGAFFFNRRTHAFRRLLLDPGRPGRKLNLFITDSSLDPDGAIWFSTGEGMVRCSANGRMQKLYPYPTDGSAVNSPLVFGFFRDAMACIWISSDHGLMWLDPGNNAMRMYRHERLNPDSLSNNRVNAFMEDKNGSLWIGSEDGLNLYDRQRDNFSVFKNDPADPTSLSSSQVQSLMEDSLGRTWVGTANGLNLMDKEGGRITFKRYLAPGPDPRQNYFLACIEESRRNFWLGTKAGLARFDTQRGVFTYYDLIDGVSAEGLNEIFFFFRSRDGEFFFGGRPGLTAFRPARLSLNLHPPPVVVTDLRIEQGFDNSTSRQVPGRKDVRVELAALDFVRPERNQYAYLLEGRDRDWTYLGTNRVVLLSGLPVGRYTLRVKAANNDGIWNEEGTSLPIQVRPPFLEQYAPALLTGFLLAVLAAVIFWRRRRSRRLGTISVPDNLDQILDKFAISKREAEIVRLLLAGKSNKEIEAELFIAMATVKIHVHNIFQKIKVGSRLQLLLRIQQESKKHK